MTVCALVGAVDFNGEHFRSQAFDYVVAVDGGYAHLETIEAVPDLVLGDFDSLGYVPDHPHVETHPTHKDASDIELAMERAVELGFDTLVVYGCLSGRLDHTYGMLQLVGKFSQCGCRVFAIGDTFAVTGLVGVGQRVVPEEVASEPNHHSDRIQPADTFPVDALLADALPADNISLNARPLDTLSFDAVESGTLSAFALTDEVTGVDEIGLEYPLDKATLVNTEPLGVSNEFTGRPATVAVVRGTLLVFFPLSAWGALK